MRYVSFFSGVEMASLAWQPLGWELVSVAEVEPFACAVLKHYHPSVPNLGDVSKISDDALRALGPVDVAVFGFPCQDLSIAGNRKGLTNSDGTSTRSGLFFDAIRHVRTLGARWVVGENVPGLFSSNEGRDFGAVLGEIVGCSFDVPRDGWASAGAATGPRGAVCWRTLDAQYAGLAQRRERVFFVADLGDGASTSPIFPILESMPGDTPACVAERQRSAARSAGSTGRKSIWEQIATALWGGGTIGPTRVANALGASRGGADDNEAQGGQLIPVPAGSVEAYGGNDTSGPRDVSTCLNAKGGVGRLDFESETLIAHTLRGGGFDASEEGAGKGTPLVPLCFSSKDYGNDTQENLAPTLRSMNADKSHANGGGQLAVAFNARQDPIWSKDCSLPLDTDPQTVGVTFRHGAIYDIRRLTPEECEKLMGVPVGYTNIPYRGRNSAPDGPRYKCLGNGFAVPELRWIGERLQDANVAALQRSAALLK